LAKILRAREINEAFGGLAVMPWEVDDLPEEWLDAVRALMKELPRMRNGRKEAEAVKQRLMNRHRGKR